MKRKAKILIALGCLVFVAALLFRWSAEAPTNGSVSLTLGGYTNDASGQPVAVMVLSNQTSRTIIPYMYLIQSPNNRQYVTSGTLQWNNLQSGKSTTFAVPKGYGAYRVTVNFPKHNWGFRLWVFGSRIHSHRFMNAIPIQWIALDEVSTTD